MTEEHLTELKARPVMEVLKDTRNILSKHKDVFPNDAAAVDNVIVKLPKVCQTGLFYYIWAKYWRYKLLLS